MEILDTHVVMLKGILWKKEGEHITFSQNGQKVILNRSLTSIFNKINGIRTVKDIVNELAVQYKETSYEDLKANVYYGLDLLYKEGYIYIDQNDDEYGGWYEFD